MPSIRSWRRAAAAGFASFNFAGRVTARHLVRVFDQFRDDSLTVVAAVGVLGTLWIPGIVVLPRYRRCVIFLGLSVVYRTQEARW